MKKTGFTLIELLTVIVILAIILAIAVPSIVNILDSSKKSGFESDAKMVLKAIQYKQLENETFNPLTITKENMQSLIGVSSNDYQQINLQIVGKDLKIVLLGINKWDGLVAYGTFRNMKVVNTNEYDVVPPLITILGDNPSSVDENTIYLDANATANDAKDGVISIKSVVVRNSAGEVVSNVDTSSVDVYTVTYTAEDSNGNVATAVRTVNVVEVYSEAKGVNKPALAVGMTPVIWDGSTWINTTKDDPNWYNYTTVDKKWANVKTADGSMWVWIPRYIYRISSSGWHTGATGVIDIQFSMGTDDTRGGTVVLTNTGAASDSNNKWTSHPAFKFGVTELTGLWVAKFEASGSLATINIVPNVSSIRAQTVGNMFTAVRNMETNSRYGWGTTGSDIDTHMMKNTEWGAVAYLAKSAYGKDTEIWANNSSTYTTGCAGSSINAASYSGCQNIYSTATGILASSTGTIYGIYDLKGGAAEAVSSYVDDGAASITTYGADIASVGIDYKNAYSYKVGDDSPHSNYLTNANKKGDATYEVSAVGNGANSWDYDSSNFPYKDFPFMIRGGNHSEGTSTGIFNFSSQTGASHNAISFRPTLLVRMGL
jgi:prepilin-type N-terminal cleavage/methylation domain-containing protein